MFRALITDSFVFGYGEVVRDFVILSFAHVVMSLNGLVLYSFLFVSVCIKIGLYLLQDVATEIKFRSCYTNPCLNVQSLTSQLTRASFLSFFFSLMLPF